MHPLTMLAAALGWNYLRHRRNKSTICSVTRRHVSIKVMCVGWASLTAWFLPHWILPKMRGGAS